jgi:hypothetical protein
MVVTVDIAGNYMVVIFFSGQGNLQLHPGVAGSLKSHPKRRLLFPLLFKDCLIPGILCPKITACLRTAFLRHRDPDFIPAVI